MEKYLQFIDKEIEELVDKIRNKLNENKSIDYLVGQMDSFLKIKQFIKTEIVLGD